MQFIATWHLMFPCPEHSERPASVFDVPDIALTSVNEVPNPFRAIAAIRAWGMYIQSGIEVLPMNDRIQCKMAGMTRLLGVSCALVLAGCAGFGQQTEPAKVPLYESVRHSMLRTGTDPAGDEGAGKKVALFPGNGIVVKPSKVSRTDKPGGELTLSFQGADLREVVKTVLSDILQENYIMDPRVGGTITLHTQKPVAKSALLPTLETVLRMSGAVLLKQEDGLYQVLPANMAGKGNLTPRLGGVGKPLQSGYAIQIVPLQYIGATDMAKLLEPLGVEAGAIRTDIMRNLMILSGTEPELRHMLETIEMFDVNWIAGMSVGLFTLQNVEVKTLVSELEKFFGGQNMGVLAGAIRIVPLDRINAILVVTPQAGYLDQVRAWIERLDRSGLGGSSQRLYVYPVQNGKAEYLAGLLNDALGKKSAVKAATTPTIAPGLASTEVKTAEARAVDGKAAQTGQPQPTAQVAGDGLALPQDVRVIADKDNNTLLILASAADYEKIEGALKKLDTVPRQVLIEVTIAEISLKDELAYGLEWAMKNGTRYSGQLDLGASGIAKLVPGLAYSWTSPSGDINAVLNLLATDSKLKIISSPHITVADNQSAKIEVGDQVPTITQTQAATSTTTGVISSVQYMTTGVLLNVKPRVNAGGLVTMEINQEISDASKTTSSSIDSPTISKRSAQSTVTVQSGETLVMAGLIKEQETRSSSGLPWLSEIPLIGGLFGTQKRGDDRTELIILITPKVLQSVRQATEVTESYRGRISELEGMLKNLIAAPEARWNPEGDTSTALVAGPAKLKPPGVHDVESGQGMCGNLGDSCWMRVR